VSCDLLTTSCSQLFCISTALLEFRVKGHCKVSHPSCLAVSKATHISNCFGHIFERILGY
jgi:hypothetical protein